MSQILLCNWLFGWTGRKKNHWFLYLVSATSWFAQFTVGLTPGGGGGGTPLYGLYRYVPRNRV